MGAVKQEEEQQRRFGLAKFIADRVPLQKLSRRQSNRWCLALLLCTLPYIAIRPGISLSVQVLVLVLIFAFFF
jgi:hypothetical protein